MIPHSVRLFLGVCLLAVLSSAQNVPPTIAAIDPATPILNQINDVSCILYSIIMYCSAGFAALLIMLAGIEYMTSESDPVKRDRSKTRVIYAVAGLILVMLACPLVDYLVTNTKILPFQRACDCFAGHAKATTTTTMPTTTTTTSTFAGGTTTSTTTSSTTTTLATTGGKVVFDTSWTRFKTSADSPGPSACDNSKYALNIAAYLDSGNKKVLIYAITDNPLTDFDALKSLLAGAGYAVDVKARSTTTIDSALLSPYGQVWFIDNSYTAPTLPSAAEISAIDAYHNSGGILLSGEDCESACYIFFVREISKEFGVTMGRTLNTSLDANYCISPSFTAHQIGSGIVKISSTGTDVLLSTTNPNVQTIATIGGKPCIMVL